MSKQIQLKLSLSPQLDSYLTRKSKRYGVPKTQYVKHLILEDAENNIPTYEASERTIRLAKEALKNRDSAVKVRDVDEYFKDLASRGN